MKLKETDWDAPGGAREIEVEYPDAIIADFMNWIRKTSAWLENLELVHRRVRRLNGVLSDWRDQPRTVSAATGETVVVDMPSGDGIDWKAKYEAVATELQAIHAKAESAKANRLAALDRARKAKEEKKARRAARAGHV